MTTINSSTLKQSIHPINGYVYVTDESEIKEGDWCILFDSVGNLFCDAPAKYDPSKGHVLNNGLKKVLYSNDPSLSLPVFEIQDEKIFQYVKANERLPNKEDYYHGKTENGDKDVFWFSTVGSNKNHFSTGVFRHIKIFEWLEEIVNPAKWNDEDLRKAFNYQREKANLMQYGESFEEFKQSLTPQIASIDWEAEEVRKHFPNGFPNSDDNDPIFQVKLYPNNRVNAVKVNYK